MNDNVGVPTGIDTVRAYLGVQFPFFEITAQFEARTGTQVFTIENKATAENYVVKCTTDFLVQTTSSGLIQQLEQWNVAHSTRRSKRILVTTDGIEDLDKS
ncbi:hypothetical protein W02_27370 [Nitrospira sp. KM1]|uniref:hypothetical protein n=1 Tax=Nitrospira sp. KM1 TaxID=1936990 RepID=UPI0013A7A2B1|nr:hypothetical protein [Nitrospira sp. KM1]BCA55597.1 hypothetical protein W02_27370 [Nitrospira sp. KM1]